jgi:hypothetical protein
MKYLLALVTAVVLVAAGYYAGQWQYDSCLGQRMDAEKTGWTAYAPLDNGGIPVGRGCRTWPFSGEGSTLPEATAVPTRRGEKCLARVEASVEAFYELPKSERDHPRKPLPALPSTKRC